MMKRIYLFGLNENQMQEFDDVDDKNNVYLSWWNYYICTVHLDEENIDENVDLKEMMKFIFWDNVS
jgi:hypothetical protein